MNQAWPCYTWVFLLAFAPTASLSAQELVRWQPELEAAQRTAEQSGRLVLIHFWAEWCGACQGMERQVFSRADVAAAVERGYVPVKLNADENSRLAQEFRITALPTTIIVTPQGRELDRAHGALPASDYISMLTQIANDTRIEVGGSHSQQVAAPQGGWPTDGGARESHPTADGFGSQHGSPSAPGPGAGAETSPPWQTWPPREEARQPAGPVPGANTPQPPPWISPAPVTADATPHTRGDISPPHWHTPGQTQGVGQRPAWGQGTPPHASATATPPRPATPTEPPRSPSNPSYTGRSDLALQSPTEPSRQEAGPPPSVDARAPQVGIEGFCPVVLVERRQWVPGDRRWGAFHRGTLYLFAGPQERDRFMLEPDRFAPVNDGKDVVASIEQGKSIPGRREHGVFFQDRVYLFANEASLDRFSRAADHYAEAVLQTNRPDPTRRYR